MLNNKNNNTKVVLVTGAARRIGAEIAKYFHQNNYNIIIHYNTSKKDAELLCENFNNIRENSAKLVQCNLASLVEPNFSDKIIENIINQYNQIDVLVNNASSFFPTDLGDVNLDAWRDLMISNAGGPFFLAQALSKYLTESKGCIINISDIHAKRPLKNYSVYSIAKAANDMVTKSLARELAPNVRVNAVAPGAIMWPEESNELSEDKKKKITDRILLKKHGSPIDIAQSVYFLANSPYITGQILAVDGGRSIKD